MVNLKKVALLALCVLALHMLSFGEAEVTDGFTQLPLLLRPNVRLDPGAVVLVGRDAHQSDVVASAFVRLGFETWIGESTERITFKRPDLKLNFAGVSTMALNSLKVCNVGLENRQTDAQGLILVSVGGPDVCNTTKKVNLDLPVKLLKDYQNDTWTISAFMQGIPEEYPGDEYGMIAFLPNQTWLNGETQALITNGHKQVGTLIVAGNGREGTLAAAMCLRDILNGTQVEGRLVSRELDKILIWMVSGEKQRLHPIVVIVKSTGQDTAEVVDVFLF